MFSSGKIVWILDQVSASAQRQIQNREVDLERSEKGFFSVGPLTSFITFLQSPVKILAINVLQITIHQNFGHRLSSAFFRLRLV